MFIQERFLTVTRRQRVRHTFNGLPLGIVWLAMIFFRLDNRLAHGGIPFVGCVFNYAFYSGLAEV